MYTFPVFWGKSLIGGLAQPRAPQAGEEVTTMRWDDDWDDNDDDFDTDE